MEIIRSSAAAAAAAASKSAAALFVKFDEEVLSVVRIGDTLTRFVDD